MLESDETGEHTQNITELASLLEVAIRQGAYIGRKAQAEQVEKIDVLAVVTQQNYVATPSPAGAQSFQSVLDASRREITQEGVSSAERQKAQCRSALLFSLREKPVDDFERSTVAADGEKIAESGGVCLTNNRDCFAGLVCSFNLEIDARLA